MSFAYELLTVISCRHVALLQIQGKEFELTPLPLRTVRPFVMESIVLSEIAEEEGLNLSDQMEITKYLKNKAHPTLYLPFSSANFTTGEHIDRAGERAVGGAQHARS